MMWKKYFCFEEFVSAPGKALIKIQIKIKNIKQFFRLLSFLFFPLFSLSSSDVVFLFFFVSSSFTIWSRCSNNKLRIILIRETNSPLIIFCLCSWNKIISWSQKTECSAYWDGRKQLGILIKFLNYIHWYIFHDSLKKKVNKQTNKIKQKWISCSFSETNHTAVPSFIIIFL